MASSCIVSNSRFGNIYDVNIKIIKLILTIARILKVGVVECNQENGKNEERFIIIKRKRKEKKRK